MSDKTWGLGKLPQRLSTSATLAANAIALLVNMLVAIMEFDQGLNGLRNKRIILYKTKLYGGPIMANIQDGMLSKSQISA